MRKNFQFLGIVALVVLVFGLISWGLLAFDPYHTSFVHLTVGIAFLIVFILGGGIGALTTKAAKRVAGFGASVVLYSVLFTAVLVMANYYSAKHELFRYDSTEQKVYTLAPQSEQLLSSLTAPLEIRAFYLGGSIDDPKSKDLIERIVKKSEKITLKIIDPEKNPEIAEKFGITENKTLHFLYKQGKGDRESKISRTITEQEIANAILKLTQGEAKAVYYLSGHGEPSLEEASENGYLFLKEAVAGENLILKELALEQDGQIPEDAAAIILAAPQKELLPGEFATIENYLQNGGRAILLHQPRTTAQIVKLAKPLGIEIGNDIVVDQVVRLFQGPALGVQPMITAFAPHPITKSGMKEGVIFGPSSSVQKSGEVPAGAKVIELALSSKNSWAEKKTDLIFSSEPQAAFEGEDLKGPVSLAATYQKIIAAKEGEANNKEEGEKQKETRVVVFGDADFVNNSNIRQLYNQDFFLNSLQWVIGEQTGITIRSASLRASTKGISEREFYLMLFCGAILLPELVVILGLAVWWYRKS